MKQFTLILLLFAISSTKSFAQDDAEGCKDHAMFNRLPSYYIVECSKDYNEVAVRMSDDVEEMKEGTKTYISYDFNEDLGTEHPSFFQIVKNHENALAKTGGKKIHYLVDNTATFFTKSGNKDVWIMLNYNHDSNYGLTILEMEPMVQELTANAINDALNNAGKISLYINFDTGKSTIKSESQNTIDELTVALKSDATLKVSIEGHTDNVGTPAANKTLSEQRAQAVLKALVAKGIDASRLSAKGWGQEKPAADNSTDDGKAQNRRVEIVKL